MFHCLQLAVSRVNILPPTALQPILSRDVLHTDALLSAAFVEYMHIETIQAWTLQCHKMHIASEFGALLTADKFLVNISV